MSDRLKKHPDQAKPLPPAPRRETAPQQHPEQVQLPKETRDQRRVRIEALRERRALRPQGRPPAFELAPLDPDPGRLRRRSLLWSLIGFLAMVAVPTALAGWYYYAVAADRYVAELRYSVRGGATSPSSASAGGMGGAGAGLVHAADSFVLEDYLHSPQAALDVAARTPLREMLDRDGDDPVRGFDPDMPIEDLVGYWRAAIRPRFDAVTGITTVEVAMFRPQDAAAVGRAVVDELERIVDSLSAEQRREMLAYVEGELARARAELERAREAIEAFRRVNRIITPEEEVSIGSTVIGALSGQLAEARVALRALQERAPNSPRIPALRGEIASLEAQLAEEAARRSEGEDAALPAQLTGFEALQAEYEIARETYVSTLALKQEAEAYATLGQAELVVFVPPRAPVLATEPDRPLEILKVFGVAFALWLLTRIVLASLRT